MSERDGGESRKNRTDGARLNPKRLIMGDPQPSLEERKVQRLELLRLVGASASKWSDPNSSAEG